MIKLGVRVQTIIEGKIVRDNINTQNRHTAATQMIARTDLASILETKTKGGIS